MVREQQAAFWDAIGVFDRAVRELLKHIDKSRVRQIFDDMPKKSQKIVDSVCEAYFIEYR